jgi:hypothetical protein
MSIARLKRIQRLEWGRPRGRPYVDCAQWCVPHLLAALDKRFRVGESAGWRRTCASLRPSKRPGKPASAPKARRCTVLVSHLTFALIAMLLSTPGRARSQLRRRNWGRMLTSAGSEASVACQRLSRTRPGNPSSSRPFQGADRKQRVHEIAAQCQDGAYRAAPPRR